MKLAPRSVLVLLAALLVGFASAVPDTARADVNFGLYIRASAGGVNKDPVNLAFTGNGILGYSMGHFGHHMGWAYTGGSTMYFQDHGSWEPHQDQRATGCDICTRDHIRWNQSNDAGPAGWDTWTMGAVHYEVSVPCVHSSRSFNDPRNVIADTMDNYSEHLAVWQYWGNTAASQQCDSVWTSGDGWIVRINIP
jgi:hypothetical protein